MKKKLKTSRKDSGLDRQTIRKMFYCARVSTRKQFDDLSR